MAGYDPSRDQILWQCPEMSADGLIISLKMYVPENQQQGKVKVDFTRRTEYNGQVQFKGGGRFTIDDMVFLHKWMPEVANQLMQHYPNYQARNPVPLQQG